MLFPQLHSCLIDNRYNRMQWHRAVSSLELIRRSDHIVTVGVELGDEMKSVCNEDGLIA